MSDRRVKPNQADEIWDPVNDPSLVSNFQETVKKFGSMDSATQMQFLRDFGKESVMVRLLFYFAILSPFFFLHFFESRNFHLFFSTTKIQFFL